MEPMALTAQSEPTESLSGRLAGKAAIMTGGGQGLGQGIVRKFVEEGARVCIFEISKVNGEKVAGNNPNNQVFFFEGDVTKEEDWQSAVEAWVEKYGGVDVVVTNAGVVHRSAPSTSVPQSEYERMMAINVSPLYHSAKVVHPIFAKQHRGNFVNISSISAPRPRPHLVWYAGSKGAVSVITKGLAAEFAKDGIRVNAILPVLAETGMVSNVLGGEDTVEGRVGVIKGIPLGRLATGRDVGNAACFLASDEADFITGVELPIDGGRSLN